MHDYDSLLQAFPFPVALLDTKNHIILANQAWDRLSLKPLEPNLFARPGTDYAAACRQAAAHGWEVATRLIRELRELQENTTTSCSLEYRCTEDGVAWWFRLTASPVPGTGLLIFQKEHTAEKHIERHLQRLTTAVSAAANAIAIVDREGLIEWINPSFTQLTGYTEAEVLGEHMRLFKSGKQSEAFYQTMWRTILAGAIWEDTLINRRKDGSLYHERMSITPIKTTAGHVTHFIAIKQDVTEHVQREKVLHDERAFLTSIVEHIPIQIFVKDATELRYVRVNSALERQLGHSRQDMIGKSDHDFWPKEQADFFVQKDREVLQLGKLLDIPEEPIHVGEETRWLHTQKIPILSPDGQPEYLLGISEDITERKRQEHELIKAKEQAESVARLKTRLLHQLNHQIRTPLTSIIGFAEELIGQEQGEQIEQARFIYQSGLQLLELFESVTEATGLGDTSTASMRQDTSVPATRVPSPEAPAAPPERAEDAEVMKRRLLVVEDNYVTRRLMERALLSTFEVVPVGSYQEALETLTAQRFDMCLFDIDLDAGHTGIELLLEMRDVPGYEHVPAIACTAHTMAGDRERFLGVGFQGYVAKPFTKKRLEEALQDALREDVALTEPSPGPDITLPAPPPMFIQTVRLLNASSKEADLESLTRLIDRDPVAAAWVLRHVNSGYFTLSRRVVRVDHAVKLLGFKPVCNLLLGGVLSHAFADRNNPGLKRVYEHIQALSIMTAAVSRHLAGIVGLSKDEQEIIFTGGLLHQLGRMIMLRKYGKAYAEMWRSRDNTAQWSQLIEPSRGREFLAFEIDYVRLGAQAARAWQLGKPIETMIAAQHHPHTLGDATLQKQVLLMALSRVAATALIAKTSTFPACFKEEPAHRRLGELARLLNLASEEVLEGIARALDAAKSIKR